MRMRKTMSNNNSNLRKPETYVRCFCFSMLRTYIYLQEIQQKVQENKRKDKLVHKKTFCACKRIKTTTTKK